MMNQDKLLLTPREAAARYGTSVQELARWRRAGTGPAWYALSPRTIRYAGADLDAWFTAPAPAPAPAPARDT